MLLPEVSAGPTIERTTVTPMLFGAAGGFISFIALVFSLLFLVVQYGNTSVSPRLTIFRDDPMVWHTFGFFTAVFAYCLVGGMITGTGDDQVTILVPAVGILLLVTALAMSRALQLRALRLLQFTAIMEEVRTRGEEVLTSLYRTPFASDEVDTSGPPTALGTALGPAHDAAPAGRPASPAGAGERTRRPHRAACGARSGTASGPGGGGGPGRPRDPPLQCPGDPRDRPGPGLHAGPALRAAAPQRHLQPGAVNLHQRPGHLCAGAGLRP